MSRQREIIIICTKHSYSFIISYFFTLVPTPHVLVTALNNQQVGDPLLLECNVTTVRGITSSVNIVWRKNGTEVGGAEDVSGEVVGNTVIYRNVYKSEISLWEHDNRTAYQCFVNIHITPPVKANSSHTIGMEAY